MHYTATYDPGDNKLRLRSLSRLDKETYERVRSAGFIWAPKQELFVAPMWTPEREDLLLELAGEIDDEDTSLVDRAEQRAERFEDYSSSRAEDAQRARDHVASIADGIPLGQPILVGHHSERHARRDAEKIENGMRRAVEMWETSQYWRSRAAGAIRAAKYKELPAVRARRIKGLEADKRKAEKHRSEADMWLKLWTECQNEQDKELQLGVAKRIAGMCWLYLPRKEGDKPDFNQCPTADSALSGEGGANYYPTLYAPRTLQEIFDAAQATYPRQIARCDRWIAHYTNRLEYERAMLAEAGGTVTDRKGPEKGGACRCWASPHGGWSIIQKVNKVSVTVLDNWGNGGGDFTRTIEFDKLKAIMTAAEVQQAREEGRVVGEDKRGFILAERKAPEEPKAEEPATAPAPAPAAADFDAMRESLKAGVQVVAAPQLFPTPPELAARMVEAAGIEPEHRVLEPSVGTGNIAREIFAAAPVHIVAVEINLRVLDVFKASYKSWGNSRIETHYADFLEQNGNLGTFDRVIMNPPFENASDIRHIKHALTMLKPGGRLVAICANGPRQREQLLPLAEQSGGYWEDLPAGTFEAAGTGVNTALVVIEG